MNEIKGLTWKEATRALRQYGLNESINKSDPLWKIFYSQLQNPLIVLLAVATLISLLFGNINDSLVIFLILLINLFIVFNQKYRSNNTFNSIQKLIKSDVYVIRNGQKVLVDKSTIVPGDVFFVRKGDVICADSYIIENNELLIDESKQTGATDDIYKELNKSKSRSFSNGNLFSGSYVVNGEGIAQVFSTGNNIKFTAVNKILDESSNISTYEKRLNKLSRVLLFVAAIATSIIFLLNLLTKIEASVISILLFSVAIFISVLPLSLPLISKLTLSRGAIKLSDKNVVTKSNSAIENLGNIEVICTDKIGTLTLNRLKVDFFSTVIDKDDFFKYSYLSTVDNNDLIDKSILKYLKENRAEDHSEFMLEEIPFEINREFSVRKFKDFEIIKGSHEYIFKLTKNDTQLDRELVALNVEKGLQVISLALKENNKTKYIGSFFYYDQVKENARNIIEDARELGVAIKIISDDKKEVTAFVAQKAGLISNYYEVITGAELNLRNPEKLLEQVTKHSVFAECSEEEKYKIIECLQTKHFTAYIGDGIKDSSTLALANIGIALDTATDIAKLDSEVVLLSNGLDVVVNAITESRNIFENLDKYLRSSLTGKFGGFLTIGLLSFVLKFLPMLSVQILIYNLLTDLPLFSLSADNNDSDKLKMPFQYSIRKSLLFALVFGIISLLFDLIFFYLVRSQETGLVQTQWFILSVITEIVVLFSLRTRRSIFNFKTAKPGDLLLKLSLLSLCVTLLLGLLGLPGEFVGLPITSIVLVALISLVYFVFTEAVKVPVLRLLKL